MNLKTIKTFIKGPKKLKKRIILKKIIYDKLELKDKLKVNKNLIKKLRIKIRNQIN